MMAPHFRRPVRAARTLWACHPVRLVRSLMEAPRLRLSRVRICAFLVLGARTVERVGACRWLLAGFDVAAVVSEGFLDITASLAWRPHDAIASTAQGSAQEASGPSGRRLEASSATVR